MPSRIRSCKASVYFFLEWVLFLLWNIEVQMRSRTAQFPKWREYLETGVDRFDGSVVSCLTSSDKEEKRKAKPKPIRPVQPAQLIAC